MIAVNRKDEGRKEKNNKQNKAKAILFIIGIAFVTYIGITRWNSNPSQHETAVPKDVNNHLISEEFATQPLTRVAIENKAEFLALMREETSLLGRISKVEDIEGKQSIVLRGEMLDLDVVHEQEGEYVDLTAWKMKELKFNITAHTKMNDFTTGESMTLESMNTDDIVYVEVSESIYEVDDKAEALQLIWYGKSSPLLEPES
jgi:hypothetical protein